MNKKSRGRATTSAIHPLSAAALRPIAYCVMLACCDAALANPTGPVVVNGAASFANPDARTLTVTNSPGAIINWQGFSIGAGELTRFNQQSAASAVLNRVVGGDISRIYGTLSSNGRVMLINPQGIMIGASGVIDTAGFIGSTLNMQDRDFIAGKLRFEGGGNGPLQNAGTIKGAGDIYLVGPSIENSGLIRSETGNVVLAAGKSVTITSPQLDGVQFTLQAPTDSALNLGTIEAKNAVSMFAGTLRHSGDIRAGSMRVDESGNIVLAPPGNGGHVTLAAQKDVTIDAQAIVSAAGAEGGRVTIAAQNGTAAIGGTVDAQGSSGAGGRVELSAPYLVQTGVVRVDGASGGSVEVSAGNLLQAGVLSADGRAGAGGSVAIAARGIVQTLSALISAKGTGGAGGNVTVAAGHAPRERLFSSGTITAASSGGAGGRVTLTGGDIVLRAAHVDASGDSAGGTVLVGGDWQGKNPSVPNAQRTQVNFSSTINADARDAGDGGKVVVWSDQKTQFFGTISVRGGARSGDGGRIEISGKENLVFGGLADASAAHGRRGVLLLDPKNIVIDSTGGSGPAATELEDPHPDANSLFGANVVVLGNGNIVVGDAGDTAGGTDAGAVYLFDGTSGGIISTITGSQANDRVGSGALMGLVGNNNFIFASPEWSNGPTANVGAVTWGSGTSGVSGIVSGANSLIGAQAGDRIGGNGMTVLLNGHYVVTSSDWANGPNLRAGAVTWVDGTNGRAFGEATPGAVVSPLNSIVGSSTDDRVGFSGVSVLFNNNFVVGTTGWDDPSGVAANAGAVTWASGTGGTVGAISSANSLVGSHQDDTVGFQGIYGLFGSSNYVVVSREWNSGRGAVTWVDGATGIPAGETGRGAVVSATNSLVGSTPNDRVGSGLIVPLFNGNYVVRSFDWNNGLATRAGAVTFGSGTSGVTGVVSSTNSLVGSTTDDLIGSVGVVALNNSNYVVVSPSWDNTAAGAVDAGAVTWVNGTTGNIFGAGRGAVVSPANSLVGTRGNDRVGDAGVIALIGNNNYVVNSPRWTNGADANAGAVTWARGDTGVAGPITALNSLVGSGPNDFIGDGGVVALPNGNYVVVSSNWSNAFATTSAGAVTLGAGDGTIFGTVGAGNSLVGSVAGDQIGNGGITVLPNGNYVVVSTLWNNGPALQAGAVTWRSAAGSPNGAIGAGNSLIGSSTNDRVGSGGILALFSGAAGAAGNYIVKSPEWNNGAATQAGAVTWSRGDGSTTGVVDSSNSLVGGSANDRIGGGLFDFGVVELTNGNYVVRSPNWDRGALADAGAVTFGSGTAGVTNVVSNLNSLVGSTANDMVGSGGITPLPNGNYLIASPSWSNGAATAAGAMTFADGATGITGDITATNSLVGSFANDQVGNATPLVLGNSNYFVFAPQWNSGAGAITLGTGTAGISGPISGANSLVGGTANDQLGSGGLFLLSGDRLLVRSPFFDKGGVVDSGRVQIYAGGGGFANPLLFSDSPTGDVTLSPAAITAITNLGTDVVLQANNDITLNAASDIITNNAGGNGGAITMQAGRSIVLNSNITTDNGALTLVANETDTNGVFPAHRDAGAAVITMAAGTSINAGTGNVELRIANGAGHDPTSGNISVGNITGGTVTLTNNGPTANSSIVFNNNAQINATQLTLAGTGEALLNSGTVDLNTAVTANLPVRIAGATVNFNGISTLNNGLTLAAGNIFGNTGGNLTVTGPFSRTVGTALSISGALSITQPSGLLVTNGAISGSSVTLNAVDGIVADGITTNGLITLSSTATNADVVLNDSLNAPNNLNLPASTPTISVSSGRSISLRNASLNSRSSGGIRLQAGADIVYENNAGPPTINEIFGVGDVSLNAGGSIYRSGAAAALPNFLNITGAAVSLTGSTGVTTPGTVTAGGPLTIAAASGAVDTTLGAMSAAAGNIAITARDGIVVGPVTATSGAITLASTATNADVTLFGTLDATRIGAAPGVRVIDVSSGRSISVRNANVIVHTSGGVRLQAGADIAYDNSIGPTVNQIGAPGDVALGAGGRIYRSGPASGPPNFLNISGANVTLDAVTEITTPGTVTATGALGVTATAGFIDTTTGALSAGAGNVNISATTGVNARAITAANGMITVAGTGANADVLLNGNLTATNGALDPTALAIDVSAGRTLSIGNANITANTSGGIRLRGGEIAYNHVGPAPTTRNVVSAVGDVSIAATVSRLYRSGPAGAAPNFLDVAGRNVALSAVTELSTPGTVNASGSLDMTTSAGFIDTTLGAVSAAGSNVNIIASAGVNAGAITASNGTITVASNATNADVVLNGNVTATNPALGPTALAIDVRSGRSLAIGFADVRANTSGGIRIQGGELFYNNTTANPFNVITAVGDVALSSTATRMYRSGPTGANVLNISGRDVSFTAVGDVENLGTVSATRDVTFNAGGSVGANGNRFGLGAVGGVVNATAAGDINLLGTSSISTGTLSTAAGLRAIRVQVTGATSDITVGSSLNTDDAITLDAGRNVIFGGGVTVAANSLALTGIAALFNTGTVTLNTPMIAQGQLAIGGATVNLNGTNTSSAQSLALTSGTLNVNAGRLQVAGNASSNGTINLKGTGSSRTLSVGGNLTLGSSSVLGVELNGTNIENFGRIDVTGSAALDGTLNVTHSSTFNPAVNDTFQILTFASRTGDFAVKNFPTFYGYSTLPGVSDYVLRVDVAPDIWTNASGDGLWQNNANWRDLSRPTATDDAIIPDLAGVGADTTVTVSAAGQAAARVVSFENLMVSAGDLTLGAGSSTLNSNAQLTVNGGTLTANGPLLANTITLSAGTLAGVGAIVNNTFNWSGGTIARAYSNAVGATMNVTGGAAKILSNATLTNDGTLNIQSGGSIRLYDGANFSTLNNNGTLNIDAGASGFPLFSLASSQDGNVVNGGILNVNTSASFETRFTNLASGTLNLNGAGTTLSLQNAQSMAGTVAIGDPAATLWISEFHGAPAAFSGTTVTGPGTLLVAGGGFAPVATFANVTAPAATLSVGNAATVSIDGATSFRNLAVSAGTLGGTAPLAVTGNLAFSGGTLANTGGVTVAGNSAWTGGTLTGNLIVPNGSAIALSGAGDKVVDGASASLSNAGSMTIDGDGNFILANGGAFTNSGAATWNGGAGGIVVNGGSTLTNAASGTMTLNAAATDTGISGAGSVRNDGLLRSIAAGIRTLIATVFDSAGSVNVQAGTLRLAGSGADTGAYVIDAGTSLEIAGARDLNAGSVVSGAGALVVTGTLGVNTPMTIANPVQLTGASAALAGSGGVTLSGPFDWSNGAALAGAGVLTTSGATTISGAGNTISKAWINEGTVGMAPGSALQFAGAAWTFTNRGTFDLPSSGSAPIGVASGSSGLVRNEGIFNKAGAGTQTIGSAFQNTASGKLNVSADTLSIPSFDTNAGLIVLANGATLATGGALLNTGTIAGNGVIDVGPGQMLTNSGVVRPGASPGTLAIDGDYMQTPAGTLAIEIGGLQTGQHDVLQVSGTANLGGTLAVDLVNGFTPRPANIEFMTYAQRSGDFAAIMLPQGPGSSAVPNPASYDVVLFGSPNPPNPPSTPAPVSSGPTQPGNVQAFNDAAVRPLSDQFLTLRDEGVRLEVESKLKESAVCR